MRMLPSQNSRSKSPKPTFGSKLRFGQHDLFVNLVVLPTSHEVLVGLNIIPHLQRTPSSTSACWHHEAPGTPSIHLPLFPGRNIPGKLVIITALLLYSSTPSRVPGPGWAGEWGRHRILWRPVLLGCRGKTCQRGGFAWSRKSFLSSPLRGCAEGVQSRLHRARWSSQGERPFCPSEETTCSGRSGKPM